MLKIEIDKRCEDVNLHPTDPQKEAGNYKMGHISVKGMKIAIENPKGSRRTFKKDDGSTGYVEMQNHYGYFNVTKGKDGDAVDVFIGPNIENFENVFCVDQNKANGEFDETKVMLGFSSKEEAKEAYMSNYSPDWKGFRDITSVSIKDFKKWLYRGRKQRQPFADYVYIQKKKLDEMKKVIKLNEADLMKVVKNAVKKTIKEAYATDDVYADVEPMLGEKRIIKLSESDIHKMIRNAVKRVLKENYEPTQADWDDFGFWASSDEPDLVNDEIGDEYDKEHPEFLIDSDDEGEGYSRDYQRGIDYAEDLIAKNRVPENAVAELEKKEKLGTISAFELGILDTIADEN